MVSWNLGQLSRSPPLTECSVFRTPESPVDPQAWRPIELFESLESCLLRCGEDDEGWPGLDGNVIVQGLGHYVVAPAVAPVLSW